MINRKTKNIIFAFSVTLVVMASSLSGQIIVSKDTLRQTNYLSSMSFKPAYSTIPISNMKFEKFNAALLPFFCKIEHKIESKSTIALRFRLGELNYVNMLENKR